MHIFLREIVEPLNSRSHCVSKVEGRKCVTLLGRHVSFLAVKSGPEVAGKSSHISNRFGIICQEKKSYPAHFQQQDSTRMSSIVTATSWQVYSTFQYLSRAKQLLILLSYARKEKFLLLFSEAYFN
jgi:hypothetical protein